MIDFYKNDSGMKISAEELANLVDYNLLDSATAIILLLDEGFIEEQEFDDILAGLLSMINKQKLTGEDING